MNIVFLAWLAVFMAFVVSLIHEHDQYRPGASSPFSQAHHFWYASTLYWMAAACLPALHTRGWLTVLALVGCWLGMVDDAAEHFTGRSLVRWAYGKLGGTL